MQKISKISYAISFYTIYPFRWVGKILFKSFPSVIIPDKRWALLQTLLSFDLFCVGFGFAMFTLIPPEGSRAMTIGGWILFGVGMAGLLYTMGLGIYFYNKHGKKSTTAGEINKRISDDLKRIREAGNERNKKPK